METKNNIENEENDLKMSAPLLFKQNYNNPLKAPVDYFDEFPTRISQKVIELKKRFNIADWLILLIKPRVAIPVFATILIAIAGINYMNNNMDIIEATATEEITVEEQLSYIDESTLVESLISEDTDEATETSTEETEMKNYLLENNMDEVNFNNQL